MSPFISSSGLSPGSREAKVLPQLLGAECGWVFPLVASSRALLAG